MYEEEQVTQQDSSRWFIDLEWYQQNDRSFLALTRNYLCSKCRKRLGREETEVSIDKLLTTIRDCCSKSPQFISRKLPILECVLRLLLASGNQSLSLDELSQELNRQLGGDTYRTSPGILTRLLSNDRYYGLRRVSD